MPCLFGSIAILFMCISCLFYEQINGYGYGYICASNYDLDPARYYTSPGLAWDAMLKATKVTLQLPIDPDMLLSVEKALEVAFLLFHTNMEKLITPVWEINK